MLKIYGNPMSTCTRKVLTTLAETEPPFEMSVVDIGSGQHKQEAHLRHQPFGRIPALDDDGFELFESRAMCRYLNEKASGKLEPSDIKARAKMEQWISIETSEFSAPRDEVHLQLRLQARAGADGARGRGQGARDDLCGVMEKQLAKTPFLAGAEFSIADIGFMPYIDYAMATPAKDIFSKHPHLMAWWNRVSERPSWRKATAKA